MPRARASDPTRVFIVGFPRSGTTLLQSLLAAHPDVYSLPETFFFQKLVSANRLERLGGRAGRDAGAVLESLSEFGLAVPEESSADRVAVGSARRIARRFTTSLDAAAASNGAACWIEKTPMHLHRVRYIERYVPNATFVHMVRSGLPAIASLYVVTKQHPEKWDGARSPHDCLERWRGDLRLTRACVGRPRHHFVSYERLVADTREVVERVYRELRLPVDEALLDRVLREYGSRSRDLIRDEPWKAGVSTAIVDRNAARADTFPAEVRERLEVAIAADDDLMREIPFI